MSETIGFANSLEIRKAGKNELWLQDRICENPDCLGLGELVVVEREKRQSSGGRLDILLKDSEDSTMYEVEIMLGKTDESHIIRTIEYWDLTKRKWPHRAHYAVLVAEEITNRFFNVIHLLSRDIPIIAIQVSLVEVQGQQALSFTKVLDVYEEEDDDIDPPTEDVTRETWIEKSKWTVETADSLKELMLKERVFEEIGLRYKVSYIAVVSSDPSQRPTAFGANVRFFLSKMKSGGNKSSLLFRVKEEQRDELAKFLEEKNVQCKLPGRNKVRISIDKQFIEKHKDVLIEITKFVKAWL